MSHPLHRPSTLAGIERRLAEQYLNTYCRETGHTDPRLTDTASAEHALADLCNPWRSAGLSPFVVDFPALQTRLAGAFSHFSPIGYHRLGSELWLQQDGHWRPLEDATRLSTLIAAALATTVPAAHMLAQQQRLQGMMLNSIEKVRRFHQPEGEAVRPAYVMSEQGLRFGHIFHVTSKASDGFSEDDLRAYAPELGASFALYYFAVRSDLLEVRSIERKPLPLDPAAMQFAEALLREGEYRLLPCHPWQARYLLAQDDIAMLVRDRALIPLGPLGERAWPTSSVRTVWLPQQQLFLKLSLNIRITNFIRNNPDEHVTRALDASAALQLLPPERIDGPQLRVLLETASATLKLPDEALRAACAVIYRESMPAEQAEHVHLVAALLEESATGTTPLQALLQQAAGAHAPDVALLRRWWQRYLDITLVPMLGLFADYGISLEAHLQNSLVRFEAGWPARCYARDMEGSAISRARFPFLARLAADSPVLYDEAQAWHRFQYYVLVNHIGHVAACLGRLGVCEERLLWEDARQCLRHCTGAAQPLAQALLAQPDLPAKANMLSSFHQRGETPAWISIPNPLRS